MKLIIKCNNKELTIQDLKDVHGEINLKFKTSNNGEQDFYEIIPTGEITGWIKPSRIKDNPRVKGLVTSTADIQYKNVKIPLSVGTFISKGRLEFIIQP